MYTALQIIFFKTIIQKKPVIQSKNFEEIGKPIQSDPNEPNENMRKILFNLFESFDKEKKLELEEKAKKNYLSKNKNNFKLFQTNPSLNIVINK
ncbi:MAG: hypothetical protein ACRCUA_06710 [Fusobacteriaceae bacterium]